MEKPFKTYDELIKKLRDEKGMAIPDEERAVVLLKRHGYFSLISGYKSLFKQKNGLYQAGTTIEDVLVLFEFDNNLRDIFFRAIQIIEKHIKSLLSYAFVEKYGDSQDAYLSPENYRIQRVSKNADVPPESEVYYLIQELKKKVVSPYDHKKYIRHQWINYRNVPLWVIVKAVTLGTTSKMYSLCTQDVQARVSREFPMVSEEKLVGMLDYLTRVRNVCAHNERLYDFDPGKKRAIQMMPLHKQLSIPKEKNYYKKGQRDLFAAVVCLKYLLSPEEYLSVPEEIQAQIQTLCSSSKLVQESTILSRMGFPGNWYDSIHF